MDYLRFEAYPNFPLFFDSLRLIEIAYFCQTIIYFIE